MNWLAAMAIGLLTLVATPAGAQESGLRILMTGDESRGWEAVGRLNMSGKSFCTGALVAPDLVLTAAHCMYDIDTKAPILAGEIEFLAGWRNGRASAYRKVTRVVTHPDFNIHATDKVGRVAFDLALLRLDQPIRNGAIAPYGTGVSPDRGDRVGVVSYAHDRATAPSLQEMCSVLARQSGVLVLTCSVDFGSSGAPIFMIDDGVATIVSVVSAKAEMGERQVSLGTNLREPLSDLMFVMGKDNGVFDQNAAVSRNASGAKFVRP